MRFSALSLKKHYILASLVKGEVLSPEKIRATTGGIVTPPTLPKPHHPLLAPSHLPPLLKVRCCRPKKFGRLPEGLPHHHPSLAPTLPKPHHPLLCTTTLASLVKGEVDCRQAKDLKIRLYYAIYQTLVYLQLFCLQDGGD